MRSAKGIARPVKKCDRVASECAESGDFVKFQEYKPEREEGTEITITLPKNPDAPQMLGVFLRNVSGLLSQFSLSRQYSARVLVS